MADPKQPETITVFDPDRGYGTIPAEEAGWYIQRGLAETPEQTALRKEKEQYDTLGNTALAAGAGLARGATLGLSDVAAEQLGLSEELERADRLNPIVSTGGELLGSAAGLGKLGATSKLGKAGAEGVSLLSAPARGAVALGRGVEGAAAAGAARLGLGTTGQSVARLGLGGAAEGALFGGGQALSEMALAGGDYENFAERVMAGGSSGALFGLGAGGTLGLVTSGGTALGKLLGRAAKVDDEVLNERAIKALGARGTDIRKLRTEANVQELGKTLREYRLKDGRKLIDPFDTAEDIAAKVEIARKEAGAELGSMRETVERAGGQADVRGYLARVDEDVIKPLRESDSPTIRAQGARVEREMAGMRQRIDAFDNGQRQIDAIAERLENSPILSARGIELPPDTRALLAQVRAQARSGTATELASARIASDVLAPLLKAPSSGVRREAHRLMGALDDASKSIAAPVTFSELRKHQADLKAIVYPKAIPGQGLPAAPPAHAEHLLRAERMLEDTMESHIEKTLARVDPGSAGKYREARALTKNLIRADEIGRKATMQNLGNRSISPSDYGTGMMVTAGQLAAGDVTAPIQGALAGWIHQNIRERGNSFLVNMADRAKLADSKIAESIAKFVRGASDVRRLAVGHGGGTEAESVLGKMRNESTLDAIRRVTAAIQAGPQHESAAADEFAPETGKAVSAKTARVYGFLAKKIPPPLIAPASPLYPKLTPHPSEIEKFARYYQAATKPLSVLDKLEAGQLAPEHIEAIRECWPRLFQQIQAKVAENLQQVERLPAGKRFALGGLLDVPTDPALEQSALQHAQDVFARQPAQQQPPPNTPPAKPVAKSFQGEAERLESQELAI